MSRGPLDRLSAEQRDRLRPAPAYGEVAHHPMLAVLSDRRSFGDDWIFERKLDGVRALAARDGDGARLLSRNGKPLDATYPEVTEALSEQKCRDFVVDGEIVAVRHGRTDFALLQRRMQLGDPDEARASGVRVVYYLFDVLRLDGCDVTRLPLRARKALLRDALDFHGPLHFTSHRNHGDDRDLLGRACASGWEGLIAKRADAAYVHRRSDDWLKLKCGASQEFVIGGFTDPEGSRVGFGALLIGYHEDGGLRYAGKVGTGYDRETLLGLRRRMDRRQRSRSPFDGEVREGGAHWVRPELVAQIGFSEWTRDGMLRHPRFLGLRNDKKAAEVVREEPAEGPR
jgi:DNA ligase D-like protein (predicted ligase)